MDKSYTKNTIDITSENLDKTIHEASFFAKTRLHV